jgi:hypothetical protein
MRLEFTCAFTSFSTILLTKSTSTITFSSPYRNSRRTCRSGLLAEPAVGVVDGMHPYGVGNMPCCYCCPAVQQALQAVGSYMLTLGILLIMNDAKMRHIRSINPVVQDWKQQVEG